MSSIPALNESRIRVGLIGAAVDPARSWGSRAHIPALRHLSDDFELTALCTSQPETAAAVARHFGVERAYSDPRKMAEDPNVDLVVVSVKTPLHRELVTAALGARKHVYCEWPLGGSTATAAQILDETRSCGVRHMIGMQGRFNEAMAYARDLIAEGMIGRPLSVSVKVTQDIFGHHEKEKNIYTTDVRNGATILRIAAAQSLEAIFHCVGDLREVSAVISNQHPTTRIRETGEIIQKTSPDHVVLAGTLKNGAVFSFTMRGGVSTATEGSRMEINGTDGDLMLSNPGPANIHRAPLSIHAARRSESSLRELSIPKRYASGLEKIEGPARYLAHSYLHLLDSFRNSKPILNDFAHALDWHRRLDVIQQAADTGRRLSMD